MYISIFPITVKLILQRYASAKLIPWQPIFGLCAEF